MNRTAETDYGPEDHGKSLFKGHDREAMRLPDRAYSGPVPLAEDGSVCHHPAQYRPKVDRWVDNHAFSAHLSLVGIQRVGRSAVHSIWRDDVGREHVMFLTDLEWLLLHGGVAHGRTRNRSWCYCKRGQNYGVAPLGRFAGPA